MQNIGDGFQIDIAASLADVTILRMLLEQIFHNPISNAVQHHDRQDGKIEVTGAEGFEVSVSLMTGRESIRHSM